MNFTPLSTAKRSTAQPRLFRSSRIRFSMGMAVAARAFGREQEYLAGRQLRLRREQLELTQEQIAERLRTAGMQATDGTVSNFEKGIGLGIGKLPLLCVVYECTLPYAFALTDDPSETEGNVSLEVAATRA